MCNLQFPGKAYKEVISVMSFLVEWEGSYFYLLGLWNSVASQAQKSHSRASESKPTENFNHVSGAHPE